MLYSYYAVEFEAVGVYLFIYSLHFYFVPCLICLKYHSMAPIHE